MDIDLIKIVSEDLDYLTEEWTQDIDDASLRRASPVLRSLLIENQLMKVADILNEEIKIMAPFISKFDGYLNDPSIIFYQSGGAKYKGMEIQFLKQLKRAKSPEEIKADYEREKSSIGQIYPVKLSLFMKQISFMVNGVKINREEVIKYIANKRGGAHYDSSRKTDKTGSKGELEKKYSLLDKIHKGTFVADKNAVYYELLSIGQRLIESNDVQRIRQILNNAR
ncbi:MAG: hypothetical protein WA104_05315 [Thermodesulfovibrionales bacterium]